MTYEDFYNTLDKHGISFNQFCFNNEISVYIFNDINTKDNIPPMIKLILDNYISKINNKDSIENFYNSIESSGLKVDNNGKVEIMLHNIKQKFDFTISNNFMNKINFI